MTLRPELFSMQKQIIIAKKHSANVENNVFFV